MNINEADTLPLEETDTLPLHDADARPAREFPPGSDTPGLQALCLKAMKTIGVALTQMSLYRVDHPVVADSIEAALQALLAALELAPRGELRLSLEDQSLVANGRLVGTPMQIQHSVLNIFNRFRLGRLTFREGLTYREVAALCELAASRPGSEIAASPEAFLAARGVERVLLNDLGGRARRG